MSDIYLKYTGTGALVGVPARDLTKAEADKYAVDFLISTGLYEFAKPERKEPVKETKKSNLNEVTND